MRRAKDDINADDYYDERFDFCQPQEGVHVRVYLPALHERMQVTLMDNFGADT